MNELYTTIVVVTLTFLLRYIHSIALQYLPIFKTAKLNIWYSLAREILCSIAILLVIVVSSDYISGIYDEYNYTSILILYPIGSVCFGPIIAYFAGIKDLSKKGSGNSGATNVARVSGLRLGALVLILDVLKGVVLTGLIIPFSRYNFMLAILLPAVWHGYPLFQSIKGGKSVAVAIGTISVVCPLCFLCGAMFWLLIFWLTRIVSLSSLFAVWGVFLSSTIIYSISSISTGFFLLAVFISWRHKENISRIIKGEEKNFTHK